MIIPRVVFADVSASKWVGFAKALAVRCYNAGITSHVAKVASGVNVFVQNTFPGRKSIAGVCKVWITAGGPTEFFIGYPRNADSSYGWQRVDGVLEELTSYMRVTSHETMGGQPGKGFLILGFSPSTKRAKSIQQTSVGYGQQQAYSYLYDVGSDSYTRSKYPVCSWSSASSGDLPVRATIPSVYLANRRVAYNNNRMSYFITGWTNPIAEYQPVCNVTPKAYVYLGYRTPAYVKTETNWLYNSTGTAVLCGFLDKDLIFGVHVIATNVFIVATVQHYIGPLTSLDRYYSTVEHTYKFWLVDLRDSGNIVQDVVKTETITSNYTGYVIPYNGLVNPMTYKYPIRFSASGNEAATICTDFVKKDISPLTRWFERCWIRTWPITISYDDINDSYSVVVDDYSDADKKYTIVWWTDSTETTTATGSALIHSLSVESDINKYMRTFAIDNSGNLSDQDSKIPYGVGYINDELTVCYAKYSVNINTTQEINQTRNGDSFSRTVERGSVGTAEVRLSFDGDDDNYVKLYDCVTYDDGCFTDDYGYEIYNVKSTYRGFGDPSYGIGSVLSLSNQGYTEEPIIGTGDTRYFRGIPMYLDVAARKLYVRDYIRSHLYTSDRHWPSGGHHTCTVKDKIRSTIRSYRLTADVYGKYSLTNIYNEAIAENEQTHVLDLNVEIATVALYTTFNSPGTTTVSSYDISGGYSPVSVPIATYIGDIDWYINVDLSSSFAVNNADFLYCSEFYSTFDLDRKILIDSNVTGLSNAIENNLDGQTNVSIIPVGIITQ